MKTNRDLTFALLGAGGRGGMFSDWLAENVGRGSVVAVAEPNRARRQKVAEKHGIPEDRCFDTWEELLAQPKLADILLNTTLDRDHAPSAVKGLRLGYHMLIEKPMATSLEDCLEIEAVQRETGRVVSVCHSLRQHAVYREVRRLIREGRLGDVVSIDQLECVEIVHQSHSFVRGNWRNEDQTTFMLLAKSCHDLDILADLVGAPCERVSSYGSLTHFRKSNAPVGAPEFCVQGCPVERECPYSAIKVYGDGMGWAHHAGLSALTREERLEKLKTSPYGRCVYQTDNNVVDHQVVAMEFTGNVTITFTMTAFTPKGGRKLRVHGTLGYLESDLEERTIDLHEFWKDNRHSTIRIPEVKGTHGGADPEVLLNLMEAVLQEDPTLVPTSAAESLRTHAIVFAAERSRRERRMVEMEEVLPSQSETSPASL